MTIREEQKEIKASVLEYLAEVSHPRIDRTRAHHLVNILVIALLAVLCGADSFAAIERLGRAKKEFLADFLDLESGIPSHDTRPVCSRANRRRRRQGNDVWQLGGPGISTNANVIPAVNSVITK